MFEKLCSPFRFLYQLIIRFIADDGLALAGYLAFVAIMSFLPFLIFLFTLLGLIGQQDQGAGIVAFMFRVLPDEIVITLDGPVTQVVRRANPDLLTLSVGVVLWISASGVEGLRTALNRAYRTRETRRYWRLRLQSIGLVLMFSLFIVVAIACLIVGPLIWDLAGDYLPADLGFDGVYPDWVRFGFGGVSLFIVNAALYRTLPNRKPSWIGVLPGSVFVCVFIVVATRIYAFYLTRFAQYAEIYDSLGGVISTMIFFYALGAIFILGGELNAMLAERFEILDEDVEEE